jgi:hypothetical protein
MTVSEQTRNQVVAVLDRLVSSARMKDRAGLERIGSPELSGFWIDRPLRGPTDLGAVLAEPFALAGVEIACEGTIAWVSASLTLERAPAAKGRFTAVLRGTGHAWVVAQVHASLPA